jgi:hypothetical protein
MMETPDQARRHNYEAAKAFADSVSDPVVANFVRYALAQSNLLILPRAREETSEWLSRLPVAPFDLEFLARVVWGMFSKPKIVEALLKGATLDEASGWDAL